MALTITDTEITCDLTSARAEFWPRGAADAAGAWVVFHAPYASKLFDRNQAITAMTIIEELARPEPNQILIAALEGEL